MSNDTMKMHQSTEDYLEAILMIIEEKGSCRSIDVANKLNFRKSSVSVAMGKLENEGFIHKADTGEITLTDTGMQVSKKILERHEFFLAWLLELGIDEKTAYDDACRMEHALSQESFDKIKEYVKGK